jgi:hypothetical protein
MPVAGGQYGPRVAPDTPRSRAVRSRVFDTGLTQAHPPAGAGRGGSLRWGTCPPLGVTRQVKMSLDRAAFPLELVASGTPRLVARFVLLGVVLNILQGVLPESITDLLQ